MTIKGGCLCGALRYEIAAEKPLGVRVCWCRVCQYLGAGSGTVNAVFEKSAITITGETRDYVSTADSGSTMHRRHCPRCGTPVFSEAEPRPHILIVRAGTLDDPDIARPGRRSGRRRRRAGPVSIPRSSGWTGRRRRRSEGGARFRQFGHVAGGRLKCLSRNAWALLALG